MSAAYLALAMKLFNCVNLTYKVICTSYSTFGSNIDRS